MHFSYYWFHTGQCGILDAADADYRLTPPHTHTAFSVDAKLTVLTIQRSKKVNNRISPII